MPPLPLPHTEAGNTRLPFPRELTLSLDELAPMLRRSRAAVSRHIARLMAEHGFPQPLPGRRPRLWSRHQVEHWLHLVGTNSAGTHPPRVPAEDPRLAPEAIAAGKARLEARYGGRS